MTKESTPASMQQMLSVRQYAEKCNISVSTIRRLVRRGELEHVRYGRVIRIPADALPIATPSMDKLMRPIMSFKERLKLIYA